MTMHDGLLLPDIVRAVCAAPAALMEPHASLPRVQVMGIGLPNGETACSDNCDYLCINMHNHINVHPPHNMVCTLLTCSDHEEGRNGCPHVEPLQAAHHTVHLHDRCANQSTTNAVT